MVTSGYLSVGDEGVWNREQPTHTMILFSSFVSHSAGFIQNSTGFIPTASYAVQIYMCEGVKICG